ncbi:MAG: hypothetical protein L6R42_001056 [Xanthoria sp. 1 TBL-2021]|nr:MAG: hypothetical protein L6R42_001056 [Xanthoria sp. 1 TBL-2021]
MASIASAAPPAFNRDPTFPVSRNSNSNTAKRKRAGPHPDQDIPGDQLEQPQDGTPRRKASRGRQPSLRHVKNSTEVLRQRSIKRANSDGLVDNTSAGREGRQFTVANVGNNGRLYLRPIAKPGNQKLLTPHQGLPHDAVDAQGVSGVRSKPEGSDQPQSSVWSDAQTSRTPTGRARSTGRAPQASDPAARDSLRRSRTVSMSTIDGHAGKGRAKSSGFKIVIDHTNMPPGNTERPPMPVLQVPIPHYRLGTPRFSTRGTAFLHSSVYTRNSTTEDLTISAVSGPEYDRLFTAPPGTDPHTQSPQRYSQATPEALSIQIRPVGDNTQTVAVTSSPAFHRVKEPIVPSIYDALAANPDNPAIVRYVAGTREITAASPARIIAQVTSASFLDYELLSDFFLTVRAYLSTHDLLEYLLARFEWAINRFDDHGRVIRVRAFAALRHWILNYFPYDFVVDRELRVKFCKRLNALMKEVRRRSSQGPSDLKLILDLKKCWNGRCLLYWDGPLLDSDGLDNADIQPGGVAGSRDSQLTHPSQLWSKVSGVSPPHVEGGLGMDKSTAALNNWFEGIQKAEADAQGHQRHASSSGATTRSLPTSPTSEQSIQALSCTFPGLGLKKAAAYPQRGAVAHPVAHVAKTPTPQRKLCPAAPSALANEEPLRPKIDHKRSGSFSDAVRDKRTSLPSMHVDQPAPQVEMAYPYQGSLIRGAIIPPGSPYIDQFAPASPVSEEPDRYFQDSDDSDEEAVEDDESDYDDETSYSSSSNKVVYATHPGMKNIFGSIRRALSSKQVGQPPLNMTSADLSLPSMARSKSSTATSCKSNPKKTNASQRQLHTSRQSARIDLLCADAMEMFQRALMQASEEDVQPSLSSANYRNNPAQLSSGHSLVDLDGPARNHSGVTNGSRSIPIFDDTGLAEPVPNIPSEYLTSQGNDNLPNGNGLYQQDTPVQPATSSDRPKPSPLARLSNAAAVADRVFAAPLKENEPTPILSSVPKDSLVSSMIQGSPTGATTRSAAPPSAYENFKSTHHAPRSLRKYASYQSSIHKSDSGRARNTIVASDAEANSTKNAGDRTPGRTLRRRPGGDLRATENVHDLDKLPRRSRSVGSVTTYSESLRGSGHTMHRVPRKSSSQRAIAAPAISRKEAEAQLEPIRKTISLIRTRSSQPALRASFEAALAQFARIPDDEGGDIEATMLKLEGKYRKTPPVQTRGPETSPFVKYANQDSRERQVKGSDAVPQSNELPNCKSEVDEGVSFPIPPDPQVAPNAMLTTRLVAEGQMETRSNMTRSLYATSEESYNPTPILERGFDEQLGRQETPKTEFPAVPVPQPLFSPNQSAVDSQADDAPISPYDEPEAAYFRRGARCRSSIPTTTDSFLLDEDEFLSDLSSELSDDTIEPDELYEPDDDDIDYPSGSAAQLVRNENRPPKIGYLLGYPTHPPTPPMTKENAKAITSQAKQSQDSRKPPTPDPSPVNLPVQPSGPKPTASLAFSISTQNLSAHRHVPFVLSFDSAIVAQQFIIIERDALNEINWQDLIDMRWHHNSPSTLNWVEYLRTQDPTGIELVTARFNLMVKWVLSEVVLTQNIEERAMAIIKYIHIAKYCRKHHNYATLLQLTIALTSIEISRLSKTWELVPAAEKRTLKELETLVTPIKNFHNLRQEMETTNSEEGCIPVIALYIHDLTYNSQKPSQVPSTREGEPLVNFERYRTTASIVKSLLRLIDASSKYTYQPVEGAISKCLWMACLSDEVIRGKSKELD